MNFDVYLNRVPAPAPRRGRGRPPARKSQESDTEMNGRRSSSGRCTTTKKYTEDSDTDSSSVTDYADHRRTSAEATRQAPLVNGVGRKSEWNEMTVSAPKYIPLLGNLGVQMLEK